MRSPSNITMTTPALTHFRATISITNCIRLNHHNHSKHDPSKHTSLDGCSSMIHLVLWRQAALPLHLSSSQLHHYLPPFLHHPSTISGIRKRISPFLSRLPKFLHFLRNLPSSAASSLSSWREIICFQSSPKSGDSYLFTSVKTSWISISTHNLHLSFHSPKTHVASPFFFRHGPTWYLPCLVWVVNFQRQKIASPSPLPRLPVCTEENDKKCLQTWCSTSFIMPLLHPQESIHLPCSHCSCYTFKNTYNAKRHLKNHIA